MVQSSLSSYIPSMLHTIDFVGMDALFIPYKNGSILDWLPNMLSMVTCLQTSLDGFIQAYLWVPHLL